MCGSESHSKQQCFFTNAIMLLLNGGKHRRAIHGLQIGVKCASLTIQVYLLYELPRQCFYHMRFIVSWSANYFLNLLSRMGEMYFSVLPSEKKRKSQEISVSRWDWTGNKAKVFQVCNPWLPITLKDFFFFKVGAQRWKDLSVNYPMIVHFWSTTTSVRDY